MRRPCRWLYDGGNLAAEYNSSGQLVRRSVYGPGGELIATIVGGQRYWSHGDERGSAIAVSRESGASDTSMPTTYDEYGRSGGAWNIWGFTGERWLPSSELLYLRARVYHPELGRFMQPDPIGYGDGMNLYAYATPIGTSAAASSRS